MFRNVSGLTLSLYSDNDYFIVHFCVVQVSLIFSMPRTNTIRAAAHCDLLVLDKGDLQNVLLHYPEGKLSPIGLVYTCRGKPCFHLRT